MKSLCTAALVLCAATAPVALAGNPTNNSLPTNAYYSSPALLPVSDGVAPAASYPAYTTAYQAGSTNNPTTLAPRAPAPVMGDDAYTGAASGGWGESTCGCGENACGTCGCGGCCTTWWASVGGLIMTRDNPNPYWTTFETNNNPNQLLNTNQARDSWAGGAEISFGRCCGCDGGWEAIYWGAWGMNGEASVHSDTNQLSATMDMGNGVLINGNPATDYFDNAREHRITRDDTFHNAELNWLITTTGRCNFEVQWLAGFRYFNFSENLTFASLAGTAPVGAQFGDNPADEGYLAMTCDNNLYGFQVGARANIGKGACKAFIEPKVGVFGNHITSRAYLHDGNFVEGFDIRDTKDDVSFLAQIDLGVSYDINCHWSVYGGYRAVAITGVALGDNQFPAFLAAADELGDVDSNGSLILHGAFAGVEYHW